MVNNKIILNFEIEQGEQPIDRYYFSARIKLTDESRNLLRTKLENSIQLDSLDSYFDLEPENFYIYYNKYSGHDGRSELYVRGSDGKYLASGFPLNYYRFSLELSPDGSSILDYGLYPLHVIYNPDHYNKAREKVKMFGDSDLLSTTSKKVLNKLLSNTDGLTTQEIFSHLQNEVAEKEAKLAREKRKAEDELSKKNEELKDLIEKGEITLFKITKGNDIDSQRSAAVLKLDDKEITLDSDRFYIAKYEGTEFLHCASQNYDMLLTYEDLLFVLNKSTYSDLESGFYSMPEFSYAKYLNAKNHYLSDSQLSEKLSKVLEGSDEVVAETQSSHVEQPEEEVTVEKPKSEHRISKRELREEDAKEHQEEAHQPSQELAQSLFPNREYVVINDKLTIEVKYGGLTSYTPEYIKQTVKDAYEAWSENFYAQKGAHDGPVKLQLYVFKNYDEYKAHIKELSGGKDHNELWGGGTIRAHEADGTIAKTFIVGDVNGLLCAKSKILMEKMSDAFLEYATGNLNEVPEVLRTGMKLFMWSYDAAKSLFTISSKAKQQKLKQPFASWY